MLIFLWLMVVFIAIVFTLIALAMTVSLFDKVMRLIFRLTSFAKRRIKEVGVLIKTLVSKQKESARVATKFIILPLALCLVLVYLFSYLSGVGDIYIYLKDHGSMWAGIIALVGVFYTVNEQRKGAREMMERRDIEKQKDKFEESRDRAEDSVYQIKGYGFGLVKQPARLLNNGESFAKSLSINDREYALINYHLRILRKFANRYGTRKIKQEIEILDSFFLVLKNIHLFQEDGDREGIRNYLTLLWGSFFEYYRGEASDIDRKLHSVSVDGRKLLLEDMMIWISCCEDGSEKGLDRVLEIAYTWVGCYTINNVVRDIDRMSFAESGRPS